MTRFSGNLKFFTAVFIGIIAPFALAQANSRPDKTGAKVGNADAAAPATFEVASIKPSQKQGISGFSTYPGGRIGVSQYTLKMLIQEAFDVQSFQVSGGPGWVNDAKYDIEAKPEASSQSSKSKPDSPKSPPNDEQRQMLRALLVDRFQLRYHREVKKGSVYILTQGGNKLNLQDPTNKEDYPWVGGIEGGGMSYATGIAGRNASMPLLARRLSIYLGRPVLDQTGLTGSFDFKFATSDDPNSDLISSIITSIQGIGLKLKGASGPVETIVIDSAERPSDN